MFSINPDGSLTAVAGSPFAEAGTGSLAGLDFSSTSGLLFGAEASATAAFADAWTIGANGVLSSVAGSPFSTTAINSNVVLLSPNDSFLFASNQGSNSVSSYGVDAGGSLSQPRQLRQRGFTARSGGHGNGPLRQPALCG